MMRFHILACDYDGTLAHDGHVDDATLAALERLLATGRKLLLVTGRELEDLLNVFPAIHFFSRVVVENGALLYHPENRKIEELAPSPPPAFVEALHRRRVPISVGRSIVATGHPHETTVLEVIRDLGLEMQVIFNKGSVMVLPAGVNKASGLAHALREMDFTEHEVVGVGDAENDHAFLAVCECAVAVANALPSLRERADLVTRGARGAGVAELIDRLIDTDLADVESLARHDLLIGHRVVKNGQGEEVRIPPHGLNVLIAGPSGSGKSTAATSFLERLSSQRYRYCIIDPEGDYSELEGAAVLGNQQRGPGVDEVLKVIATAEANTVINLVGMPLNDRPPFFLSLLPRLMELRARTGRPHWLVIDEAHHLLPADWAPGPVVLPQALKRTLFITVHPDLVARSALDTVDQVVAVGRAPGETIQQFCTVLEEPAPDLKEPDLEAGEVLLWSRQKHTPPVRVRIIPSQSERRRHTRKYTEGELPPERSFYFRGPQGKLNLRAQNLILFLQLAEGIDDETWVYHLQKGDYSTWFRDKIKDPELADEAAQVEQEKGLSPQESRERIRALIEKRYTLPGGPPLPMPGTDAGPSGQR
jgi:HAD superfamily hydrolase (TIGR01484 family)